jgi:hypothetical protein
MKCSTVACALSLAAGLAAGSLRAQEPKAPPPPEPLQVGAVAPDFTLPGATRYGTLKAPIHLSDFKGRTVVLAFVYKARTKG